MIPKQITFMNQTWTIRSAQNKELDNCIGHCDPEKNEILLDPTLTKDVLLATLFHELIHLIEITLHQHLTESQVDVMATGIVHLLKSNPQLTALLQTKQEYIYSETQFDDYDDDEAMTQ